ncbi:MULTISPECIES: fasciclin domain-containing protein [unclassified Flavobacterium]|uniref:fasciclin domain-containing protein n=1 Tax=unclassified Flavobacterium TaxID=196869 RepID=UPI0036236E89
MDNLIKIKRLVLLFVTAISLFSCDNNDNSASDNSIAGIASNNSELSSLVTALNKTGLTTTLSESGSFTVFAPTNAAFATFLSENGYANLDAVPVNALKEILLNHVISGSFQSSSLTTGYVKTLAKGSASTTNTLSMFINTSSGVKINGIATVTTANIIANNGIIHIVDKVIGLPTIVTHATANPNFSSLVNALTAEGQPDFVNILSSNETFTVFAPTNDAFTSLDSELAPSGIAGVSSGNLTKVLKYHVVNGANVISSSLTNGQVVNTYVNQTFTVNLTPARITDANARVSNITAVDVQCSNGIIHVLDKVLLPSFE